MKRYAFLSRLEELLADLPQNERRQALQYYEEYFKRAGAGQEEETAARLGSPEAVAQQVREEWEASNVQADGIRGRVLLAVLALLLVIALAVGISFLSGGWPPSTMQVPQTTASVQEEGP